MLEQDAAEAYESQSKFLDNAS